LCNGDHCRKRGVRLIRDVAREKGFGLTLSSLRGTGADVWDAGPNLAHPGLKGVVFDAMIATFADLGFGDAEGSTLSRHIQTMRHNWDAEELCEAPQVGAPQACSSVLDLPDLLQTSLALPGEEAPTGSA